MVALTECAAGGRSTIRCWAVGRGMDLAVDEIGKFAASQLWLGMKLLPLKMQWPGGRS
jgi:hypothetical protein